MSLAIADRIKVHALARELITDPKRWTSHAFAVDQTFLVEPQVLTLDPVHIRPEKMNVVAAELRALFELKFIGFTPNGTPLLEAQCKDIKICLGIPEHVALGNWNDWGHESTLAGLDATVARLKYQAFEDEVFARTTPPG